MTTPANCRIRVAHWPGETRVLREVRTRVFVEEQQVPERLEWDGQDETALHFLAETEDGTPIGTARLLTSGQIGRMAVLRPWRGKRVGSALLTAVLEHIWAHDYPAPFLNAQVQVVPFYARHGFQASGNTFLEAGILHQRMECNHE